MVQIKFRALLCSVLILVSAVIASAERQRVRSLKLYVNLEKDGTATVYERWDVATGDDITEWYLVRENLGDIVIDSLEVEVDEKPLHFEGEWDVHRTLEQKAGKCGIVHKSGGVELCWGIGSHGDHIFDVLYQMHGAVKSARDYDYMHLQLISPGLSSPPKQVRVFVGSHETQLDTTVARVWGFGYEGICIFEDGRVVVENDYPFSTDDSVIVLLRLDKGILDPTSVRDQDFQEVLDRAMIDADFGTDEEEDYTLGYWVMGILTAIFGGGWLGFRIDKKIKESPNYLYKKYLGVKRKDILWYRDIPFNGNLPASQFVLRKLGEGASGTGPLTSALILRMIYNGYLDVSRLLEKKDTEIRFTDKDPSDLDSLSLGLYQMMKEAAGENSILEKNEFTTWSKAHAQQCYEWHNKAFDAGRMAVKDNGWVGDTFDVLSKTGKEEGIKLMGLQKFLTEFTLTSQREAIEAHLWKEYLVYSSIMGIARIVAQQLKEIAPTATAAISLSNNFYAAVSAGWTQHMRTLRRLEASSYSYSSGRSSHSYSSSSSRSGYGGRSSHHGGGGHSSGGRGGGGR